MPAPTAVADQARTTQGTGIAVDVLSQRHRPARSRVDDRGCQRERRVRLGECVGHPGRVPAERRVLRCHHGHLHDRGCPGHGCRHGDRHDRRDGHRTARHPSTPQATADNATATVTWGLPPANGSPITAVELSRRAAAAVSLGATSSHTLTGLVNGRPYRFQVRAQNEAGWGEWSGWSAPVTPDTIPGRVPTPAVAFGDGQLTVTWQAPPNEGSSAHRLRDRDRRRHELGDRPRHRHHLRVGRADERHQLPVPHRGDQRRRPLRSVAVVRPRASAPPTRRAGHAERRTRQPVPRPELGTERQQRRSGHRVPGPHAVEPEHLGTGRHRHVVPLVRPAQRRRPTVPGALAQP